MVDLVKIRKKAKEQEAKSEASREAALSMPEVTALPSAEVEPAVEPGARQPQQASAKPLPSINAPPAVRLPVSPEPAANTASVGPSKLDRFKELAGKRRDGLVQDVATNDESERIEVLTFAIAGEHYAAGIERVVEIIPIRGATRVPNADSAVRGIISLRGTIVTIMDARARLGHPRGDGGPDSRIIVVERGSETLGFEVDRVLRVVKVDASDIEPHPVVHASEERGPIRGVFRQATALTILLDLDKLLA